MNNPIFILSLFVVAVLYSSVGHGGASGYLAVMSLAGMAPAAMRPAALCLNIAVSTIAFVQFLRRGSFSWKLFWPIALCALPFAWLGGLVRLPDFTYRMLLGLSLLCAAWRLVAPRVEAELRPVDRRVSCPVGALIGFIAGLTGIGGGVFLSPVLILARWANPRTTAAVSAAFILSNSFAGLAALASRGLVLPKEFALWLALVVAGGSLGSYLGSRSFSLPVLRRVLAVVLALAALKLLLPHAGG